MSKSFRDFSKLTVEEDVMAKDIAKLAQIAQQASVMGFDVTEFPRDKPPTIQPSRVANVAGAGDIFVTLLRAYANNKFQNGGLA